MRPPPRRPFALWAAVLLLGLAWGAWATPTASAICSFGGDPGLASYRLGCEGGHRDCPDEAADCVSEVANVVGLSLLGQDLWPGMRPCVSLDVTLQHPEGTTRVSAAPFSPECSSPHVEFRWNATASSGNGTVTFNFDPDEAVSQIDGATSNATSFVMGEAAGPLSNAEKIVDDVNKTARRYAPQSLDARPRPLSPLTALLLPLVEGRVSLPPERTAASAPTPLPRLVVTLAFDASWGSGCGDARGHVAVSVNGQPQRAETPDGLFRDLCGLSFLPDPSLVLGAVEATAALAAGAAPSVPPLAPVADAIVALLPTLAPPPPPPAPSTQGDATGDATLALFGAEDLVAEKAQATLSTPLGEERVSEGASVPAPALGAQDPAPPGLAISGGAPAPASPLAPEPAPLPPPADAPAAGRARDAPSAPPARDALVRVTTAATPSPPELPRAAVAVAAAAAGALLALAAIAAAKSTARARILRCGWIALYQRIRSPHALQHEGRAALLRACQEAKRGATVGELAALTGMNPKTAEYHLRYLARLGHLRAEKTHGAPTRFAVHSAPRPPEPVPPPLDDAILARVAASPGASASDIARDLGAPRLRIDGRVKELILKGILTSRVEAGRRGLYAA